MGRREQAEVLFEIKNDIPNFDKDELSEYTKWAIKNLYNGLKGKEQLKVKCEEKLKNKLLQMKERYRLIDEIDHISIQNAQLLDYIKENDEKYIKLYVSICFYDNASNNAGNEQPQDDLWDIKNFFDIEIEGNLKVTNIIQTENYRKICLVKDDTEDETQKDRYWNDIWIVTYKQNNNTEYKKHNNCVNCGAVMKYDEIQKYFKCEYCGNTVHNKNDVKWELFDVDLENKLI